MMERTEMPDRRSHGLNIVVRDSAGKGIVYKTPYGSVRVERFDPAYHKRYPIKGEPRFTIYREGLPIRSARVGVATTLKEAAEKALKAAGLSFMGKFRRLPKAQDEMITAWLLSITKLAYRLAEGVAKANKTCEILNTDPDDER